MKILISGGTGLIGKELGKALVAAGHQLLLVSRNKKATHFLAPYPHQSISWTDLSEPVPEVQDVDAIINLAGAGIAEKRWSSRYKNILLSSRKDCTEKLVVLAHYLKNRLKVFISASAIGYYGHRGDKVMTETSKPGKSFLSRLCCEWEKALEPLMSLKNTRIIVFRMGMVLSEKGGALKRMSSIFQSSMAGKLGKGTQYISWIDIQDLVRLYVFVLDHHIAGTFNAVAPNPIQSQEFTHSLAQTLGVSDLLPVPSFAIKLYMGEMSDIVLHSQRVSCEKIRNAGFQFNCTRVQDSFLQRVLNVQSYENVLFFEQWLPTEREKVFAFFNDPSNLTKITPPRYRLKMMPNSSSQKLKIGGEIFLKFSIYSLLTFRSKLRVLRYEAPAIISITQEDGPCRKWTNIYQFEDLGEGVIIKNKVNLISSMSNKVRSHVEKIFHFRQEKLFEKFSS